MNGDFDMMEPETELTEQPLNEPAVQPETAVQPAMDTPPSVEESSAETESPMLMAAAESTAESSAEEPPQEFPELKILAPPPAPRSMSSHEFEMAHYQAFLEQQRREQRQNIPLGHPLDEPGGEPLVTHTADKTPQQLTAQEAYWKKVLTGNPDSIPEELRTRAGMDDMSVSLEEREYRLLNAVNRSWLADHSEMSREDISARWPELRAELCRQYGVEDDEHGLFTALSTEPEVKAQQEQALTLCRESYLAALMKQNRPEIPAEENPAVAAEVLDEAYRCGIEQRNRLQPLVQDVSMILQAFRSMESATPVDMFTLLTQMPELGRAFESVMELDADSRKDLYEMTLRSMKEEGTAQAPPSNLMLALLKSTRRGMHTMRLDLLHTLGQGTAAAADVISRIPGAEKARGFSEAVDKRMMLFRELAEMAKNDTNPIHAEGESYIRQLAIDTSESIAPAAVTAMGGGWVAMTSGLGSALAATRQKAQEGNISLQTAAGMMAIAAQEAAGKLFSKVGGKIVQGAWKKFGRFELPQSVKGKLARLSAKGAQKFAGGAVNYQLSEFSNEGMQELAARVGGTDSHIDWNAQWSHLWSMETNFYEAVRNLPFVLIGARRAALSHFRHPMELVADGPRLTEWGVPEETQQRIREESDPTRRNRLLADALNKSDFRGSEEYMKKAQESLNLLPMGETAPFRNAETLRDFLNLPPQTAAERALEQLTGKGGKQSGPGGEEPSGREERKPSSRRLLKLRLITDEWQKRAYTEELPGYLREADLAPKELARLGNHGEQADKARAEAVGKTIRYIDALSYRILLNTTSYNALHQAGKQPAAVKEEAASFRRQLYAKVAEAVMSRAVGESPAYADKLLGDFVTEHYLRLRNERGVNSWLKQIPVERVEKLPKTAFGERAMRRGAELRKGLYPEIQEAYWMLQGLHFSTMALGGLLSSHSDFHTALSRGMTPPEAYAHLLKRELGERLVGEDWKARLPEMKNMTDWPALMKNNKQLADTYVRLTGRFPESRTGDDGKTYWRVQKPDGRYTHWHDSVENCINDLVTDGRMRFLPMGADVAEEAHGSGKQAHQFDAAQLGMKSPHLYSYYDRLSALSTGDLTRFWQEDATLTVPGTSIEMFRPHTSVTEPVRGVQILEHPDYPGMWQVDARSVRSPYGLARARFETYWRNLLSSGSLSAEDAADFLIRRGVIDAPRREEIFKVGRSIINGRRGVVTPARFFSDQWRDLPKPYANIGGRNGLLAAHLADYTSGYFMAHMHEMPLPPSVREWFALTPFRLENGLYDNKRRTQKGRNGVEQTEKWAHQNAALVVQRQLALAERLRSEERSENGLEHDPLFPLVQQAFIPEPARRAEQGWGYSLGGSDAFMSVRPEYWNLMLRPVRSWEHLDAHTQERLRKALPLREGEKPIPVEEVKPTEEAKAAEASETPEPPTAQPEPEPIPLPKALEELDAVLQKYPELHEYELHPEDESRIIRLEVPPVSERSYRRWDGPFDHPSHTGENVISGGFKLQEVESLPPHLLADERVIPALRTLATLRRTAHESPFADAQGVWWNGECYGGKNGKKLVGMDDTWYADEPLRNIRRLFSEMPEDGSPVMTFGGDLAFARREPLPEDAFRSTTVFRSGYYPLSQVRLMPGEHAASWRTMRHPYVTHSFIGAPMYEGKIIPNKEDLGYYFTPLEDFHGDVTREMIGHMAGWWGKKATENMLDTLMWRTSSPEQLRNSRYEDISNREILMQLAEDMRFSASLEGRSPHELNAEEALAATWLHTLAEYECGVNPEKAAQDLLRFNQYFTEHPERLEAVHKMLDDHRVWYGLDPTDQWYHVVTATHEIRRANALRREREEMEWKKNIRTWMEIDDARNSTKLEDRIEEIKNRKKNR